MSIFLVLVEILNRGLLAKRFYSTLDNAARRYLLNIIGLTSPLNKKPRFFALVAKYRVEIKFPLHIAAARFDFLLYRQDVQ
jgi:hypothetical protein